MEKSIQSWEDSESEWELVNKYWEKDQMQSTLQKVSLRAGAWQSTGAAGKQVTTASPGAGVSCTCPDLLGLSQNSSPAVLGMVLLTQGAEG